MKYRDWKIPYDTPEIPAELTGAGFTPLLSEMLVRRGLTSVSEVRAFLSGSSADLPDPMLLRDMDRAVARIRRAIRTRERVAVFGDYDVDGITSTCLLSDYLRKHGVSCRPYIPDRIEEGYGLSLGAVDTLHADGVTLIITVDCGITAAAETQHAAALGIDMVITDHHECGDQPLPEAAAVVDPKRTDSDYPNRGLAGVGVAFKLLCALEGSPDAILRDYADLTAIGTVADVMPLLGENRYLTLQGLHMLNTAPRPGLRALLRECGALEKPVTASTIGFTLAPRINAAGRLGRTAVAAQLLMTESPAEAERLAAELCELNHRRQALEQQIWEEASAIADTYPPETPIVLASDSWHQGVIGIAASRLSEAFRLPTIMIRFDGDHGKGSCRSFGGFNLYNALSACSDYLEGFGGHALAAGLTIRRENISLFRKALDAYYKSNPASELPELTCDLRITDPRLLSMEDIRSLDLLEPCGSGNPRPQLCILGVRLVRVTPIGGGRHLRLHVAKAGYNFECIFFGCTPEELTVRPGQWVDIAFCPQINEFRGRCTPQLLLEDIRPADPLPLCRAILEHRPIPAWDAADFCPIRTDFVIVWRWLRAPLAFPLPELPSRCPPQLHPAKLCLCLMAMAELGLVRLTFADDRLAVSPVTGTGKVNLMRSRILQELRACCKKLR